jgi:hypothetical protein
MGNYGQLATLSTFRELLILRVTSSLPGTGGHIRGSTHATGITYLTHCFDDVAVIMRQKEDAAGLPRRGQLPKCLVPYTNTHAHNLWIQKENRQSSIYLVVRPDAMLRTALILDVVRHHCPSGR